MPVNPNINLESSSGEEGNDSLLLIPRQELAPVVYDEYLNSQLLSAVGRGDLEEADRLSNEPTVDVDVVNDRGLTPLMIALIEENEEMVSILIENGANPDCFTNNINPLMYIIREYPDNFESRLRLLIDAADDSLEIDAENENGQTALMYAIEQNNDEAVTFLIGAGASATYSAFVYAFDNGIAEDVIEEWVRENDDGVPALIEAAQNNNQEVIDVLVQSGADLNAALIEAAQDANQDIISVLVRAGADLNAALIEAAQRHLYSRNYQIIVDNLVDAGADPEFVDDHGLNALMHAAKNGNKDMMIILMHTMVREDEARNADEIELAVAVGDADEIELEAEADNDNNIMDNVQREENIAVIGENAIEDDQLTDAAALTGVVYSSENI